MGARVQIQDNRIMAVHFYQDQPEVNFARAWRPRE